MAMNNDIFWKKLTLAVVIVGGICVLTHEILHWFEVRSVQKQVEKTFADVNNAMQEDDKRSAQFDKEMQLQREQMRQDMQEQQKKSAEYFNNLDKTMRENAEKSAQEFNQRK